MHPIEIIKVIHSPGATPHHGHLIAGRHVLTCALGRSGISRFKREGDGATPAGSFRPLEVRYRADRLQRPQTRLPTRPIAPDDGWGDAPFDANYNRPLRTPYPASHERMWRDDYLYDLLVVLDHNTCPRIHGRGSAVFFHLARPDYGPTEGCIAISRTDMERLLPLLSPETALQVG